MRLHPSQFLGKTGAKKASDKMGRLVRSRLKAAGINIRRDSYFLLISCTSLLLYAICLYTFLHLNGYIGAKNVAAPSPSSASAPLHGTAVGGIVGGGKIPQASAHHLKGQVEFDDGKIHEFQHNVGQPVDWEMRVKGIIKTFSVMRGDFRVYIPRRILLRSSFTKTAFILG